jgi:hypothetical protein
VLLSGMMVALVDAATIIESMKSPAMRWIMDRVLRRKDPWRVAGRSPIHRGVWMVSQPNQLGWFGEDIASRATLRLDRGNIQVQRWFDRRNPSKEPTQMILRRDSRGCQAETGTSPKNWRRAGKEPLATALFRK